jgi:hypothetical protein
LTLDEGEALAPCTLAMIDANQAVIQRAGRVVLNDRHETDRARVASDLHGLREVERLGAAGSPDPPWCPGSGPPSPTDLRRTAALYGVE